RRGTTERDDSSIDTLGGTLGARNVAD
ncbi:MAG: hypothetical protein EZS28_020624, partial [Streblomastix strix]